MAGHQQNVNGETNPSLLLNSSQELNEITAKNNELTKQLHSALIDLANVEMCAVLAEGACTDVAKKIENFKLFKLSHNDFETLKKFKADMFDEIEQIVDQYHDKKNESVTTQIENDHEEDVVTLNFQNHTLKLQNMARQLHDVNSQLAIKEQLLQKIIENLGGVTSYDPEVTSIDTNKNYVDQINELVKELDELKNRKIDKKSAKLVEDRRKKVQELEADIQKLRKKCMQQEKSFKVKVDTEIREMNEIKVQLLRQMHQESEQFHLREELDKYKNRCKNLETQIEELQRNGTREEESESSEDDSPSDLDWPICNCHTDCSTNKCTCKKQGEKCGENCGCSDACINVN